MQLQYRLGVLHQRAARRTLPTDWLVTASSTPGKQMELTGVAAADAERNLDARVLVASYKWWKWIHEGGFCKRTLELAPNGSVCRCT